MQINNIKIEFLGHSGFLISVSDRVIAIDPYNVSDNVEKVDYIFITHSHYDHCSIKDIIKISKNGTVIIVPADAQSKITRVEGVTMQVIESGDELSFEDNKIKVEAVPAYNIGKEFHTKADGWLGYLLKFDNVIVYHSGDTDKIPEMQKLSGYGKHGQEFVALLPVSGTYVMTADEAADVAKSLNASLAIPMHYGAGVAGTIIDAEQFVKACKQNEIAAQILDKI